MCSYAAVAQLSPEELRKHASELRHQARVQEREIKTAEFKKHIDSIVLTHSCLLYTSPSPRDNV